MPDKFQKYYSAFIESQAYLVRTNTTSYPIDIDKLIAMTERDIGTRILLSKVSDFHKFIKKSLAKHYIKDGKTYFDPNINAYVIVYNEEQHPMRIRFTILHELAHIILGHLKDERTELFRGGVGNYLYYKWEGEANTFAGSALAPPILIKELLKSKEYNPSLVSKKFKVSSYAAEHQRKTDYLNWLKKEPLPPEHAVYHLGKDSINITYCYKCSTICFSSALYCRICGNENLKVFTEEESMLYSSIEIDEQSKAKKCPNCNNENIYDGDFCPICGICITNKCTGAVYDYQGNYDGECGTLLKGDSRYCHKCGEPSTFAKDKLLADWTAELEAKHSGSYDLFLEEDDELPFPEVSDGDLPDIEGHHVDIDDFPFSAEDLV